MRFDFNFQAGVPQSGFIQTPLPSGPFIKIPQHDPRAQSLVGRNWNEAYQEVPVEEITWAFDLELGFVILGSVGFKVTPIGAWYDTSD